MMISVRGSEPESGDGGMGGDRSNSQAAVRMRRRRKAIKLEEAELRAKSVIIPEEIKLLRETLKKKQQVVAQLEVMVKSDSAYYGYPSQLPGPAHVPAPYLMPHGPALSSTMHSTHSTANYLQSSEPCLSAPVNSTDTDIHSLLFNPALLADPYVLPDSSATSFTGPSPNLLETDTSMMVYPPSPDLDKPLSDPSQNGLHPATSYMADTELTKLYPTYLKVTSLGPYSLDPTNIVLANPELPILDQQDLLCLDLDQGKMTRWEQRQDRGRKVRQEKPFMYQLPPQQDPRIEHQRQQAVRAQHNREKRKQQMKLKLQQKREKEAEVASLKDEMMRLQQSITDLQTQCLKPSGATLSWQQWTSSCYDY